MSQNLTSNMIPGLREDITADSFNVAALNDIPASASAIGTVGEIRFTAAHIYVCTATDTWVRVAIATF